MDDASLIATLVGAVTQLALGAAAWRLASALKLRVDDHEQRIEQLERVPVDPPHPPRARVYQLARAKER